MLSFPAKPQNAESFVVVPIDFSPPHPSSSEIRRSSQYLHEVVCKRGLLSERMQNEQADFFPTAGFSCLLSCLMDCLNVNGRGCSNW
jgi:hypothetical protein